MLVVGEPDVVAVAEYDAGAAIEVLEVAPCLTAEEARIVVAQVGDERVPPVRWQAAPHCRTDDLQHPGIRQVPEYPGQAIEY
jgi:hypothetical protein